MTEKLNIESAIASIRGLISTACRTLNNLEERRRSNYDNDNWYLEYKLASSLDSAFMQLLVLTEAIPLPHAYEMIRKHYKKAKRLPNGLGEHDSDPDGDLHLRCLPTLERVVGGIEAAYGLIRLRSVSKELIEIIRGTQYAITDANCFPQPPGDEADVHKRIEAVLRCIFPDLRHKPPIGKPIKNFAPDTGIPSQRTLIEYKFLDGPQDVGRIADEILADTRGYVSSEWDSFLYVIYETKRIKPETEWSQMLEKCGTARNTQAIVLCGESLEVRKGRAKSAEGRPCRKQKVTMEDAGSELTSEATKQQANVKAAGPATESNESAKERGEQRG